MIPPSVKAAAVVTAAALIASVGPSASTAASRPDDGKAPATLFGAAVQPTSGQAYQDAVDQADRQFGRMDVVRYFDPDLPNAWKSIRADTGDRPVVVSFKASPAEVLAGDHDRALRQWFRSAPDDRRSWWSYLPEPEEGVETGEYSSQDFRRAWRHIDRIASGIAPKEVRSSLSLMCYTLNPSSNRNWRDYYPGDRHVDVMGWDCYNWAGDDGRYASPRTSFGKAIRLSRKLDKPWAIAEIGSVLAGDDEGAGRARWLRRVGRYAAEHDARYVTYFNADVGVDYILNDARSQRAWRDVIDSKDVADKKDVTDTTEDRNALSFADWVSGELLMFRTWHRLN